MCSFDPQRLKRKRDKYKVIVDNDSVLAFCTIFLGVFPRFSMGGIVHSGFKKQMFEFRA